MFEPENEQLQAVIIAQDCIDATAELFEAVNDDKLGVEIDPLGLYCQKTGYQIGKRDENSLFSFIKIRGKNEFVSHLYYSTALCVHPAWLITDDMEAMMQCDPVGYACYCFMEITKGYYQNSKNSDPKRKDWAERYWALARANRLMQSRGISEITELNAALCRIITFDAKDYLFKRIRALVDVTPDALALLHCSGELTEMLHTATNACLDSIGRADLYIKKTRYVDYALTPADAARGAQNIRKQKTSKRAVQEASMFAELSKLFTDAGLDFKPSDGSWKQRYMSKEQIQANADTEAKMLADLAAFGGSNLLGLNEDEDDNEVEVRTLAVPVTGYVEELSNPIVSAENSIDPMQAPHNSDEQQYQQLPDAIVGDMVIEFKVAADMRNVEIQPAMKEIARQVEQAAKPVIVPAKISSLRDRFKR